MPAPSYDSSFAAATGHPPYDYQCRLACGPQAASTKPETLSAGVACASHLINIPTGLGKTSAVVVGHLSNP
ncbi:MAG: hypothetical protein FJ399_09255 [Verrucomicrobia bacterium]|nr:hypothetical protein [Verrucomicrobiota bacterium]